MGSIPNPPRDAFHTGKLTTIDWSCLQVQEYYVRLCHPLVSLQLCPVSWVFIFAIVPLPASVSLSHSVGIQMKASDEGMYSTEHQKSVPGRPSYAWGLIGHNWEGVHLGVCVCRLWCTGGLLNWRPAGRIRLGSNFRVAWEAYINLIYEKLIELHI